MLKDLNWLLIMEPCDHFMAANIVFVVRFQFLFYFLAQVANKNRTLVLFYGVLNSVYFILGMSWCCGNQRFCFVLWVLISFFSVTPRNYNYAVHYCSDVYKNLKYFLT